RKGNATAAPNNHGNPLTFRPHFFGTRQKIWRRLRYKGFRLRQRNLSCSSRDGDCHHHRSRNPPRTYLVVLVTSTASLLIVLRAPAFHRSYGGSYHQSAPTQSRRSQTEMGA